MDAPTLDDVRAAVVIFGEIDRPDRSYAQLVESTRPRIDLGIAAHRDALHRWLNAWGCRIRYAVPGDPDHFDAGLEGWWSRHGRRVRSIRRPLAQLTNTHIETLAGAFDSLSGTVIAEDARGHGRTMGPTAAAKALYALLPHAAMPWDDLIARRLHGGRDAASYAQHLHLGRRWAQALLTAAGTDEAQLVADLRRPGASLAKVLDEYCYIRFTRGG